MLKFSSSRISQVLGPRCLIQVIKVRHLSTQKITEKITLHTKKQENFDLDPATLRLSLKSPKKLVVMATWIEANPAHVQKYSSIYTEIGFDVLVANNHAINIIRPKRMQKLSGNVVKFLENNKNYDQILVHGFSGGGYLWSECLVHLHADPQTFHSISNRIKGQVWDSISGPLEASVGVASTIFTQDSFMEILLRNCINLFFKVFYMPVTKYYYRADEYFNQKPVKAATLIFVSRIDPIATVPYALKMAESFKKLGMDTKLKIFEGSGHVQHYQKYKEEYLEALMDHLKKCELIK